MLPEPLKPCLILILVLLVSCKEGNEGPKPTEKLPPNIVYILADDLGYGDIAAYNPAGKIPTPNIDKLAEEGMRFTDAHTSSAVCTPTRYGILTGRYNWRSPLKSGVLTGKSRALIPPSRTTVASMLKKAGYRTAFVGKWHLGWDWALKDSTLPTGEGWNAGDFANIDFTRPITNGPKDLGFDYSYGHSGSLDMAPYVYVENGNITAEVDRVTVDTGKYTWWREGPTAADFVHDDVTPHFFRKSMAYLKDREEETKPFFLYLALPSPHTPILPTQKWLGKSGLNPYADFVMMVDHYVGELLSELDALGLADNTMVVFTSDNGCSPQANFQVLAEKGHRPSGPFRGHKADIYEGGHRVPFIVRWPAIIEAGSQSEKTICTTDFMATCAELAEMELMDNEAEDSFSMLPLFKDPEASDFRREATVHHSINGSFAIRKDDFKLVLCPGSGGWSDPKPSSPQIKDMPPVQLFDLSKDPGERENLYLQYPEKVDELKALLATYIEEGRSTPGEKQQNSPLNIKGQIWHQAKTVLTN